MKTIKIFITAVDQYHMYEMKRKELTKIITMISNFGELTFILSQLSHISIRKIKNDIGFERKFIFLKMSLSALNHIANIFFKITFLFCY